MLRSGFFEYTDEQRATSNSCSSARGIRIQGFCWGRRSALLALVERAMGKASAETNALVADTTKGTKKEGTPYGNAEDVVFDHRRRESSATFASVTPTCLALAR